MADIVVIDPLGNKHELTLSMRRDSYILPPSLFNPSKNDLMGIVTYVPGLIELTVNESGFYVSPDPVNEQITVHCPWGDEVFQFFPNNQNHIIGYQL